MDRHFTGTRGISVPVRSLSTQHIGGASSLRSPSVRRMRQLLELTAGPASPSSGMSGHQSPAPTPSTTLPRPNRQIDINPAEFVKYKLDKPGRMMRPTTSCAIQSHVLLTSLSTLLFPQLLTLKAYLV